MTTKPKRPRIKTKPFRVYTPRKMRHSIESLFTSPDPIVVEVAQSLELVHDQAFLRSVQLMPLILGKFARDLGTETHAESIGGLTEYSITVTIKGVPCKLFSIGETPAK